MNKKSLVWALAGCMALPSLAMGGSGSSQADLEKKIEELSRQLDELKTQMKQQNETITKYNTKVEKIDTKIEEKSEALDMVSRFQFDGDFRSRIVAMSFCEPRSWTRVLSS